MRVTPAGLPNGLAEIQYFAVSQSLKFLPGKLYSETSRKLFVACVHPMAALLGRHTGMRRDDILKSDLISEVVLAGSGLALFLPLLLLVIAAVAGQATQ